MLAVGRSRDEVFVNGKRREDPASFRNQGDAAAGHLVWSKRADVHAIEADLAAAGAAKPHHAMHGGRLPHAVSAKEADDFSSVEREAHPKEHLIRIVARPQVQELQHLQPSANAKSSPR